MTAGTIIGLVAEFTAIVLLAIGFWHEKKFVAFEDRMIRQIKRRLRRRLAAWLDTPAQKTAAVKCASPAPVIRAAGVFEDLISADELLGIRFEPCEPAGEQNIVA